MKMLMRKNTFRFYVNAILLLLTGMAAPWAVAFDYPEPGDFAKGSKVWSENCARCHNIRSPSDLRDDQWITSVFHMRIRAGLTGQETRDILTFLQSSNARIETVSSDTTAVDSTHVPIAASGKHVYENNCVACHGYDGKGSLPGVPDFTDTKGRLTKPDDELLSNIINGYQSPGSLMPMPPRGGNSALSDADLSAVLGYIKRAFGQ